ncbi:hypothetical protein PIB30_097018, partial [Stylosanthes scabra]|nr:hypothetical protein [Stylosanthes scabra]
NEILDMVLSRMNDVMYVSQRVKRGIFGINYPASGNSGLSDVKDAERTPMS